MRLEGRIKEVDKYLNTTIEYLDNMENPLIEGEQPYNSFLLQELKNRDINPDYVASFLQGHLKGPEPPKKGIDRFLQKIFRSFEKAEAKKLLKVLKG